MKPVQKILKMFLKCFKKVLKKLMKKLKKKLLILEMKFMELKWENIIIKDYSIKTILIKEKKKLIVVN